MVERKVRWCSPGDGPVTGTGSFPLTRFLTSALSFPQCSPAIVVGSKVPGDPWRRIVTSVTALVVLVRRSNEAQARASVRCLLVLLPMFSSPGRRFRRGGTRRSGQRRRFRLEQNYPKSVSPEDPESPSFWTIAAHGGRSPSGVDAQGLKRPLPACGNPTGCLPIPRVTGFAVQDLEVSFRTTPGLLGRLGTSRESGASGSTSFQLVWNGRERFRKITWRNSRRIPGTMSGGNKSGAPSGAPASSPPTAGQGRGQCGRSSATGGTPRPA